MLPSRSALLAALAKQRGCRVVGIAGGPRKCAWLVDELGLDAGDERAHVVRRHQEARHPVLEELAAVVYADELPDAYLIARTAAIITAVPVRDAMFRLATYGTTAALEVATAVATHSRGQARVNALILAGWLAHCSGNGAVTQIAYDAADAETVATGTARSHLLDLLRRSPLDDRLVLNFATGERFAGGALTADRADDLRQRIAADPTVWCIKTLVPFTGRPAVERGTVTERGFALRAFALAQESGYTVLPGGLGQVLVDGADAARFLGTVKDRLEGGAFEV